MKGSRVLSVLAVFVLGSISFGYTPNRTLVYKGTIKASKSFFDVNDTTRLFSQTIKAYWAMQVATDFEIGRVLDSNTVLYDKKKKYYKVIPFTVPDTYIENDPCDPCGVVMLHFQATDADGSMSFYAVCKGNILRYSNDRDVDPNYTPKTLKGTGTLLAFDIFDPNDTVSGPITVTMTLDSARTKEANPDVDPLNNLTAHQVINDIVSELTAKGGWREWPFYPD